MEWYSLLVCIPFLCEMGRIWYCSPEDMDNRFAILQNWNVVLVNRGLLREKPISHSAPTIRKVETPICDSKAITVRPNWMKGK